jgi:hypothetical protein
MAKFKNAKQRKAAMARIKSGRYAPTRLPPEVRKVLKITSQRATAQQTGKGRTIKVLEQTGTRKSLHKDRQFKAKLPGERISATGNIYWETRRNRSDVKGKRA